MASKGTGVPGVGPFLLVHLAVGMVEGALDPVARDP